MSLIDKTQTFVKGHPYLTFGTYFIVDAVCGFYMTNVMDECNKIRPGWGGNTIHGTPPPFGIPCMIAHKIFGCWNYTKLTKDFGYLHQGYIS